MIEITIKTLDSQNHNFSVEDNITVRELKEIIADSVNVPANSQRLIYFGRVLTDEKKLSEYDVNGKVIHLVQRAPPSSLRNRSSGSGESQSSGQDGGSGSPFGRLTYMGRFGRHGESNATYLGAMAFPADLMDSRGLAPRPPTRRLTPYRLAIAETMLHLADRSLTNLENGPPVSSSDQSSDQASGTCSSQNSTSSNGETASATENVASTSLPDGPDDNLNKDAQPPKPAVKTEPPEDDSAGQSESAPKTDTSETVDQKDDDKKPDTSAKDDKPSEPSTSDASSSQSTPQIPRRITSCNLELAATIRSLLSVTNRLTPRLEEYQRIVADESPDLDSRSAQHTFDCVAEVMHALSHAYHSLSDLMCNFAAPAPRPIVCRPVLIRHSAVVQTGIPIQMINVSRTPRQTSTSSRETSTAASSTTAGTNTASSTVNDGTTQGNGVPPAAPRTDNAADFAATAAHIVAAAATAAAGEAAGAAAASAAASVITAAISSAVADAPGVVHVHLDPLESFATLIADSRSSSRPANTNASNTNSTNIWAAGAPPSTESSATAAPRPEAPRRRTPPAPAELVTTGTTTTEEVQAPHVGRGAANRSRTRIRSSMHPEDALSIMFSDIQNFVQRSNSSASTNNTNGSTNNTSGSNNTNGATNTSSTTTEATATGDTASNGPGLTRTQQREQGEAAAAAPPRSREGASQNAQARSSTSNSSSQSSRMHYLTSLSPNASNENNNEFDPFLPCNSEHIRRARDLAPPIINPPRVSDNRDALLPQGFGRVSDYLPAYGREYEPRSIPRDVANRLRTRLGSSNITTFTVTELLQSISNFYRPGESIVMDIIMTAGRYVTVEDILHPQRLSRGMISNMRPSLMRLLKEYFNMEIYSDVAVEAAIDKINLELKPFIQNLFGPGTVLGAHLQDNVDLEASISKVVQHFVPMIIKDIIDSQRSSEAAARNGEGPSSRTSARTNPPTNGSSNTGSRRNASTMHQFRTVTLGFLQQPRFRPDHSIFDFVNALTNLVFLCCKDISISEVIMALSIGMSTYVDQFAQRWFLSEIGCWFVRLQPNHEREFCANFCRKYVVLKPRSQRTSTTRRNRDRDMSVVPMEIEEMVGSGAGLDLNAIIAAAVEREQAARPREASGPPTSGGGIDLNAMIAVVERERAAARPREASGQTTTAGGGLDLNAMIAAVERERAARPREASGQSIGIHLHPPTIPPRETPPEEPLAEVVLESESWEQAVPPDWVPIITRDKREQRRAAAQGPLSDSYLCGMPSKRRKIVTSAKPHHTLSKAITESMSVALGAAGIAGNGVDSVAENAACDVDLRSAFKEQLRTSVESTLRCHPDFTPDKYPNAAKYFNPPPRHQ